MEIVKNKNELLYQEEYQALLTHIENKVSLSKEEIEILVSKLKLRTYLKGQYIVQGGDVNRYQTFICSGTVRTFYLDDKGVEHIVSFGIENWWVGDLCSFSTRTPSEFNTQCLEKTRVVQISYEDMEWLYEEIPILERFFRLLVQKAYGNVSKRIVSNHSLTAKDRYVIFSNSYPEILQRVPQYMVASYLGVSKEFLSSVRKKLTVKAKS